VGLLKLTLSNKLFAGFACLSLLTILLGLTTFYFFRDTEANNRKILEVQELIMRIKALQSTSSQLSTNFFALSIDRDTYISDVEAISKLSEKILLPGKPIPLNGGQEAMSPNLSNYRQAAIDFFDGSEMSARTRKKNAFLYRQMSHQAEEIPANGKNVRVSAVIQQLEVLKHEFEDTNDPALLKKMHAAGERLALLNNTDPIIETVSAFIEVNERSYLNTRALLNDQKYLADHSAHFLAMADNIYLATSRDNDKKFRDLRTIIIVLALASVSMTLLFWTLTSKRLNYFLENQKRAIYSISSGKYDYDTGKIIDDELGDIRRFTRDLAVNLKVEIEERQKFQQDKEQLEYQLTQAQKLESIGLLAGGVAHDFNNLLTGINGYTDLALAQLEDNHPIKRYLEVIARSGEKASDLTRQLLAFSRKQEMAKQVLDPNELIRNLTKLLNRVIGDDIILELVPSPTLPNIMADPAQIEQVLMNMAVNARDAMPNGGKLTISTSAVTLGKSAVSQFDGVDPGDFVQISISDDGIGISPELKEKVFDPFFTTKDTDRGSGLGLAMVFGIIRQHNGHIAVDSEPGQGTTFNFFLPALEEGVVLSSTAEQDATDLVGGTETILLVDDNDTARDFICETLEHFGYKVLAVDSGNAALRTINQTNYAIDLLITDVVMPEMNGQELAETVQQKYPEIKIIFMSGYTEQIIDQEAISSDIRQDFLRKPISVDTLVRRVREILDR
jgi:signal transduction histidine kinase